MVTAVTAPRSSLHNMHYTLAGMREAVTLSASYAYTGHRSLIALQTSGPNQPAGARPRAHTHTGFLDDIQLYDPALRSWTDLTPATLHGGTGLQPGPRYGPGFAAGSDGGLYLFGGHGAGAHAAMARVFLGERHNGPRSLVSLPPTAPSPLIPLPLPRSLARSHWRRSAQPHLAPPRLCAPPRRFGDRHRDQLRLRRDFPVTVRDLWSGAECREKTATARSAGSCGIPA